MAYLYKFTCKPNNPVVSKAILVIWKEERLTDMGHVLAAIAYDHGCIYALESSSSDYIGEIALSGVGAMYPDGVVTCITGEY